MDFPKEFICPITSEIMKDPVIDREGNTYEREAIAKWLVAHGTSPITRTSMAPGDLVPNRSLKDAIEMFLNPSGASTTLNTTIDVKRMPAGILSNEAPASLSAVYDSTAGDVVVTFTPPSVPSSARSAVDIVCCVDVSGSMQVEAPVQNDQGVAESHGLSVLSIVLHAVRTVGSMLGPQDRLGIVTYSSNANIVLGLTNMDDKGKLAMQAKLDTIHADGQTNIYLGLMHSMKMLDAQRESGRTGSVLLLTDGQPNVHPPRGYIPTLQSHFQSIGGTPSYTIHTFGFGYNLDSKLLSEIATEGQGLYTFIPDAGFVGTVFVHLIANLLSTYAHGVQLFVDQPGATEAQGLQIVENGVEGKVGGVQFGQTRTYRIAYPRDALIEAPTVRATFRCGKDEVSLRTRATQIFKDHPVSIFARCRDEFTRVVTHALTSYRANPTTTRDRVRQGIDNIKTFQGTQTFGKAFIADLEDQVSIAISKDEFFNKWGVHYLPSLTRAQLLSVCNNFKDHSVQQYGGALFNKLRTEGEEIFLTLPPPKQDCVPAQRSSRAGAPTRAPAAPVNMAAYYNVSGGCVLGHCTAKMEDGSEKTFETLRRGDILWGGHAIGCVVRIHQNVPLIMCHFQGGLTITPYHPIRLPQESKSWVFPAETSAEQHVEAPPVVYTLLMNSGHVVVVNGIEVVALGHGFADGAASHPFLGSNLVREQLATFAGFTDGAVDIVGATRGADNKIASFVDLYAQP